MGVLNVIILGLGRLENFLRILLERMDGLGVLDTAGGPTIAGEGFFGLYGIGDVFLIVRLVVPNSHEASEPFCCAGPFFSDIDKSIRFEIDSVSWTIVVLVNTTGVFEWHGVVEQIIAEQETVDLEDCEKL